MPVTSLSPTAVTTTSPIPRPRGSGWETERKKFRVVEFWDGQMPGYSTFDIAASFALLNIPYASGHAWWGHAIAGGFGLRKESNGTYSLMKRNSWGPSYGQDGFFWLAQRKATPDIGLFGVRQVQATG